MSGKWWLSRFSLVVGVVFWSFLPVPTLADIYSYYDSEGVLHLTNRENVSSGKVVLRERNRSNDDEMLDEEKRKIIRMIERIAISENFDPDLTRAVARAESNFNPNAVSPKGAIGIMQLMPATAKRFNVENIYSLEDNIKGGIRYLKYLMRLFPNNIHLVIAAYNSGEKRVLEAGGIPAIKETQGYVDRVIKYYSEYKGKPIGKPIKWIVDKHGNIHLTNL